EMITGTPPGAGSHSAATALGNGLVDEVVDNEAVGSAVTALLDVLAPDTPESPGAWQAPTPSDARDGWDAVRAARAKDRPDAPKLLKGVCRTHVPLRGDRAGSEDPALIAVLGRVLGRRAVVMALDRARPPGPAAYRAARRCLRIAERLQIPVITLIDTRGADPSEVAEAGGIAWEIAQLFAAMLVTEVPIVSVVTGEGGSGGALAFAVGDVLLAYEDSIFSVIGPEGAATILWRDPGRAPEAARALKLTAQDLLSFGIADALLSEPPDATSLASAVAYHLDRVPWDSGHDLVTARMERWRRSGDR
ncbi:MAG TPA: carboxyl transferase domain-containing protein, partial [Actinomycetota bacterium]|nr:carboxyl transferase domain-containing protein [Actinomycetota bacterium]